MHEEESIESHVQLLVEGNDHRNFFRGIHKSLVSRRYPG